MISRRRFLTGVAIGLPPIGAPAHAQEYKAQQAGKAARLCFLTFDPRTTQSNRFTPFFQRPRDLGYVDGQTITIDYLSADGQNERFPALAVECLRLKADIIVVTTTPAAQVAKNATRTIPIVMIPLGDPVGTAPFALRRGGIRSSVYLVRTLGRR